MSGSPELLAVLDRPPQEAAPLLLGSVLSHAGVAVRLTEVEAYAGPDDPGSHAFRRTPRSAIMYGPPGRLYLYLVYGMHVCVNVVVGPDGDPGAVLLRAGEVVDGMALARVRRPGAADRDLARGPGRLCRALGLSLSDNGIELSSGPTRLVPEPSLDQGQKVLAGPRVGLRQAADRPWRFWLTDEPTVSTYRPAVSRPRRPPRPTG